MNPVVRKVVILGESGVGKTSTCKRYMKKAFREHEALTIGTELLTTKIKVMDDEVLLQIWDTAGEEKFRAVAPMFYRNANAAILMFDITSRPTFYTMKSWVSELTDNVEGPIVLCVLANKLDLAEQRVVSKNEALAYTKTIGGLYFEISAKNDQGIEYAFKYIAMKLLEISTNISPPSSFKICELEATGSTKGEFGKPHVTNIYQGDSITYKCC